ncbi:MAG: DHHA1 domain-containing protein [Lachnospirales bacterium]
MGRAEVAEALLLTDDPARAEVLARELCELNRERQELEALIFAQCDLLVDALPAGERDALVLAGNTWHQGVVGIVASRLTEKYAVPTFMICIQEGRGKGSCRSYGGLNLFTLLEGCADLLESYGGHELAAGFTIREENIVPFRVRVNALARAARAEAEPVTALAVDCALGSPELLTLEEVEGLSLLEPYGPGNPKPVFRLDRCAVTGLTQVGNGKHMKLKLSAGGRNLDAIFFSATAEEAGISAADRVDVCFYPQINEYRSWRTVQLQLCDLRPARTRAQAEEELFRRLMEGESLSRSEAAALLPTRQEFANLWRYLRTRQSEGCIEDTAQRLARNVARSCGLRETFMRTQVCLAVFHDRGLIRMERTTDHLRIQIRDTGEKVDLESCTLMRQLRRLAEEP